MSATIADFEMLPVQPSSDADVVASACEDQRPGLFVRLMEAFGRAYVIETPDGEVIAVYPPC
jgi:hypothetical protein